MSKILYFMAILLFLLISCCIDEKHAPTPSDSVLDFASYYKNHDVNGCYSLMSQEYKNKTDYNMFKSQLSQPFTFHWCEFIGIVENSENVTNNTATLEIEYREGYLNNAIDKSLGFISKMFNGINYTDAKTKTISLVNESGVWKFNEIYYELNGNSFNPDLENQ